MRKVKLVMMVVLLFVIGVIQLTPSNTDSQFSITYLNKTENLTARPLSASIGSQLDAIFLDDSQDAYVLNKASFAKLDAESVDNFLSNGGVIVVSDNSVTYDELVAKVETKVGRFDYSDVINQYGFYIVKVKEENLVVNISLGYVEAKVGDETKIVKDKVEEEVIVEAIVAQASEKLGFVIVWNDGSDVGGTPVQTETSGQVIAYAYLENYLFYVNTGDFVCSYTIYTQVFDVAKVTNTGSLMIRGIYDVSSKFTVDAEPHWAVYEYGTRMYTNNSIIDSAYLYSNTSTTVSLGGSLGFQGNVIAGSLNAGISYTFNA